RRICSSNRRTSRDESRSYRNQDSCRVFCARRRRLRWRATGPTQLLAQRFLPLCDLAGINPGSKKERIPMQYDEIIKTVIDHGDSTERETAEKITRVVLADLGKQLNANEATDLAGQLPQELENGVTEPNPNDEQVNGEGDDFLRPVAKHLGDQVDPEQARSHVRAVF